MGLFSGPLSSIAVGCLAMLLMGLSQGCNKNPVQPEAYVHLALGNPSEAKADEQVPNNYLIEKPQFAVSYNQTDVRANWVAWHLAAEDMGGSERQNDFRPDPAIPSGWTTAVTSDYINSGFDRGHLCPSADRTATAFDNSTTFLMSNIIPQAPNLNRNTWEGLESHCRTLVEQGNELYIFAGTSGSGGTGSNGTFKKINEKITVPSACWKVVLILPVGTDDSSRITTKTKTLAVWMSNVQTLSNDWKRYLTTIDEVEKRTGYDFFTAVPVTIQKTIEADTYR